MHKNFENGLDIWNASTIDDIFRACTAITSIMLLTSRKALTGFIRSFPYSVPRVDAENKEQLVPIVGTPPDLLAPPKGCAFAARCQYAMEICYERQPEESCVEGGHCVSCWLRHPDAPKVECPVHMEEV